MGSKELIARTRARLEQIRFANLSAALLAPVVLTIAIVYLSAAYELSLAARSLLLVGVILCSLPFLQFAYRRRQPARQESAASALDTACNAKERFLTLATLAPGSASDSSESLALVTTQSDPLAASVELTQVLPFRLEPPAKLSLSISAILSLLLIALLWFIPTPEETRALQLQSKSQEEAKNLKDFVNSLPDMPEALREELLNFAENLEDDGLLDEQVQQQLDELLSKTSDSDFGSSPVTADSSQVNSSVQERSSSSETNSPPDSNDKANQKSSSSGDTSSQQDSAQSKSQEPNPQGGSSSSQASDGKSNPQPSSDGKSDQNAPKQQGQKEGTGTKEQPQGEKQEERPGTQKEKEQGKDGKQEDDPKKDTTGVGDGKSKTGKESEKEQKGESQSGQGGEEGKQGSAEHQSPDGGPSSKDSNDGRKDSSAEQQKSEQEGKSGPEAKKSETRAAEAQQKLDQLQQQLAQEYGNQGENNSSSQGTSSQGQNQGGGSSSAAQGAQSKGAGSSAAPDTQNMGSSKGEKGENSSNGKTGSSGSAGSAKEQSSAATSQEPGESQDKNNGQGKKPGSEATPPKDAKQSTSQGSGGKEPNANETPQKDKENKGDVERPDQQAKRFGPFEGGDDGSLIAKENQKTRVEVPMEEKILVRSLGATDNKIYKNQPGARAKTQLGSEEFKKPEAELNEMTQPIPVEYRDLLR